MKAVILAAGLGSRLGFNRPKGLLAPGKETLVQRSVRLLTQAGLAPVTLVVGHQADQYRGLPEPLRFVDNPEYASTGSLRSLMLAHQVLQDDLLVLESDLLYESRALDCLLKCPEPNAILTSGWTGAGDEVWIDAPDARLRNMSKDRSQLERSPDGEFVGICRFSLGLLQDLQSWGATRPEAHYESDGLVALCEKHRLDTVHVDDLIWCEVDDPHHWERCQQLILPRLREIE
ncbi:phosphocholine cytidylyltransferase family protein [bacterium]|nr:phosphocholine cytidylyltransferase family protein [bacterium]